MTNSLEAAEAEAAAIAKSDRITLADIERDISKVYYLTGDKIPGAHKRHIPALKCLTICVVVMKNEFTVVGKSDPVEPENFDAKFGKKLAYENAVRQIWALQAYELAGKFYSRL